MNLFFNKSYPFIKRFNNAPKMYYKTTEEKFQTAANSLITSTVLASKSLHNKVIILYIMPSLLSFEWLYEIFISKNIHVTKIFSSMLVVSLTHFKCNFCPYCTNHRTDFTNFRHKKYYGIFRWISKEVRNVQAIHFLTKLFKMP